MGEFNQSQYTSQYSKDHYDTLRITLYKGKAKVLKQLALDRGISVSQLIIKAVEQIYAVDLSKKD